MKTLISNSKLKQNTVMYLTFTILIIAVAGLNYLFPKTCDDIIYSLLTADSLREFLELSMYQGNGRLLGNFFGYLIKYSWFTVIEKTCLWTGIIFLIIKLVGSENVIVNTIIATVMLYPSDSIFSQVYAWNSGFQNYAFPVFIILFDMYIIKNTDKLTRKASKVVIAILLFLSSFAGQFFSENSSIFTIFLATAVLVFCIKSSKKVQYAVIYLCSTAFGFIVMMVYPHIFGTSEKISSYRKYADTIESLFAIASKNFRTISKDFAGYSILWIIVSAAFFLLISRILGHIYTNKIHQILLFASKIIICAYPIFSLFYNLVIKTSITFPRYYFNYALCISLALYITSLLFVSVLLLLNKDISKSNKLSAVLIILGIASVLPLFVVSPIGARTFYIPFVCFFISGINGLKIYIENIIENKTTVCICTVSLCAVLSVLIMAETDNSYCANVRESYLVQEIESGNDEIVLPLLPHQNIAHDDSNSNTWHNYIKKTYGKEIDFDFVEWNKWYSDYYKK